jgi:hypothetical protein
MDPEQEKKVKPAAADPIPSPAKPAPVSADSTKPTAKKKSPDKARPELEREVVSRLSFLRQAARESGHNYVVNLEHDLIRLAEAVHETFRAKTAPSRKGLDRLERALEIIDRTRLKPAKGRRKDLKRIEQAVAEMEKLLVKKK